LHEKDILIILPRSLSRREKALLRDTTRRHKDSAEYGNYIIVENNALGFDMAMSLIKELGGVDRVHTFILGRVVFDDELLNRHRQELEIFKASGKIPQNFSPVMKERLRKRPGLPASRSGAATAEEQPQGLKQT
jgi:hypothetical protein